MSLEYLNVFSEQIKIKTQSITKIKYKSFDSALAAVKSRASNKQFAQLQLLNILKSQPIYLFDDLVTYSWNACQTKNKYKDQKCYKVFVEKCLLELPTAIVPIPLVDDLENMVQNRKIQCAKHVILLSKPKDSMNYENIVVKFFLEFTMKVKYNQQIFNEYILRLLSLAKNTLHETGYSFGETIIKRVAEQLFSHTAVEKYHIFSLTETERNKLYDVQKRIKSYEELMKEAQQLVDEEEQKLLRKLEKLNKKQKRSAHASKKNKRGLLNKIANVQEKLQKIQCDKDQAYCKKKQYLKQRFIRELNKVCSKRHKGNQKGATWKHDFDTQEWIVFVLDTGNFKTCHNRKIANRIIEKNDINGLHNTLEVIQSIVDMKLYIEKYHKTQNNLKETMKIYKNCGESIWDKMGDEIFPNRIKSKSTISEYYDNRNPNTIQGKRLLKMNKKRSKNLITAQKRGKTARRFLNLNHWYSFNSIPHVNKYYYCFTMEKNINNQLFCVHLDLASKKKFGEWSCQTGWATANKSIDVSEKFDLSIFGKDRSNQQYLPQYNLTPIAIGYSKGSVVDGGIFKRTSEAFLQFCVTGATMYCKGDAFDIANAIELTLTDGLQMDTADELLFMPEEDDLKEFDLEFRKGFLKFKNRAKLISLFW
eukprot:188614_1